MRRMGRLVMVGGGWAVDWTDSPEADEIIKLLGTAIIPTPYSISVPRDAVVRRLAAIGTIVA